MWGLWWHHHPQEVDAAAVMPIVFVSSFVFFCFFFFFFLLFCFLIYLREAATNGFKRRCRWERWERANVTGGMAGEKTALPLLLSLLLLLCIPWATSFPISAAKKGRTTASWNDWIVFVHNKRDNSNTSENNNNNNNNKKKQGRKTTQTIRNRQLWQATNRVELHDDRIVVGCMFGECDRMKYSAHLWQQLSLGER